MAQPGCLRRPGRGLKTLDKDSRANQPTRLKHKNPDSSIAPAPPSKHLGTELSHGHHLAAMRCRVERFELLREAQFGLAGYAEENSTLNDFHRDRHASSEMGSSRHGRSQAHRQTISPFLNGLLRLDRSCSHIDPFKAGRNKSAPKQNACPRVATALSSSHSPLCMRRW